MIGLRLPEAVSRCRPADSTGIEVSVLAGRSRTVPKLHGPLGSHPEETEYW